jgi:hypothetical protein
VPERRLEGAVEVAAQQGRTDRGDPARGRRSASSRWSLRCSLKANVALRVSRTLRPLPDLGPRRSSRPSARRACGVPVAPGFEVHVLPLEPLQFAAPDPGGDGNDVQGLQAPSTSQSTGPGYPTGCPGPRQLEEKDG